MAVSYNANILADAVGAATSVHNRANFAFVVCNNKAPVQLVAGVADSNRYFFGGLCGNGHAVYSFVMLSMIRIYTM